MKPLKYTMAALALIAVASLTSSAKASSPGDLVLGIYDTNNTGINSYEFDLGAFDNLTGGETWNLGTTVATQYSSDSSANLVFNIAATGEATGAAGLAAKEIAFSASTLPATLSGSNTTPSSDLSTMTSNEADGTAITTPAGTAYSYANGTTGSFYNEFITHNVYGLGATDASDLEGSFAAGTSVGFYTDTNGSGAGTADGTFSISDVGGNEILTYEAAPEPSAYALGLCAVALFWVLKRRRSVA